MNPANEDMLQWHVFPHVTTGQIFPQVWASLLYNVKCRLVLSPDLKLDLLPIQLNCSDFEVNSCNNNV